MSNFADFDTVMERLASGKLWDFPGGVHPEQNKSLSNESIIQKSSLPKFLYIPIKQHIGLDAQIIVKKGQRVLKGQALTYSNNPFALSVHASSSGIVKEISSFPSAHPSGIEELGICIEVDGHDESIPFEGIRDYTSIDRLELIKSICDAGISGMGGAGFPTHIKSNTQKPIEFLIINGVECEPYISSDDRLMREHAWQIRQGIDILYHLLCPKQVIVAIEDNKPKALETMSIACQQHSNYQVISVPTKYPAGGEKQLIQVLTSREVPSDGLPIDVSCLMYNVGTCFAIADAVIEGKPMIERVVTVTGGAFEKPHNTWVRLGTPVSHLIEQAQYNHQKQKIPRIIMGGPMMGFTLGTTKIPVVKTTNCILAPAYQELAELDAQRSCIRCSACADACPASLLPQQLYWYSDAKDYEKAQQYNLFDCIECGACAYVCPSEIPLVHYYRQAKSQIKQQKIEKEQSEKARKRFEARNQRLAKEKAEREEKHRLAAEARKKSMNKDGGSAKDKIAQALARAKAKKAAQAKQLKQVSENVPDSTAEPTTAQNNSTASDRQETVDDNKNQKKADKIAAAVARAKAKRLAQQANTTSDKNNDSKT